jgi:hypothetical protein
MRALALVLVCSLSFSLQATPQSETPSENIQTGNGFIRDCSDIDARRGALTDQALANIGTRTGYMMGLHDGISVMVAVANQSNKATIKATLLSVRFGDVRPRGPHSPKIRAS